ncbi:uncharacterized protein BP5553_05914 [Venustampulla echinocandica]|uniref:Uncharacterized protein n=1 Tax=Venustampulla echinocandica TaxID=2656787 RepID=A0A370TM17_9HELO|nr:uncharacterized protein BP5553_05914 [Venustampulla echinocandica]RDL36562.1 hypothetical protein BP5553_05914 [Venustampulla echinocandica]
MDLNSISANPELPPSQAAPILRKPTISNLPNSQQVILSLEPAQQSTVAPDRLEILQTQYHAAAAEINLLVAELKKAEQRRDDLVIEVRRVHKEELEEELHELVATMDNCVQEVKNLKFLYDSLETPARCEQKEALVRRMHELNCTFNDCSKKADGVAAHHRRLTEAQGVTITLFQRLVARLMWMRRCGIGAIPRVQQPAAKAEAASRPDGKNRKTD